MAKSESQSMAAGLIGTSLGITLLPILANVHHNALGFCLSEFAIHQGCNYLGLKAVSLLNLNRQRLNIKLDAFVGNSNDILSPSSRRRRKLYAILFQSRIKAVAIDWNALARNVSGRSARAASIARHAAT